MIKWNCKYSKTISGHCEQQRTRGSDYCYYHDKVITKLIEADEENALREMPTITV